jgi:hypothetical protein
MRAEIAACASSKELERHLWGVSVSMNLANVKSPGCRSPARPDDENEHVVEGDDISQIQRAQFLLI